MKKATLLVSVLCLVLAAQTANFTPQFDSTVQIISMYDGSSNRVNPKYCASSSDAAALAALLPDLKPATVKADPYPIDHRGPFVFNHQCPYFQFPNGLRENVGQLADFFSHGYNQNYVVSLVRWNIAEDAFAFGFSDNDPGPFQP